MSTKKKLYTQAKKLGFDLGFVGITIDELKKYIKWKQNMPLKFVKKVKKAKPLTPKEKEYDIAVKLWDLHVDYKDITLKEIHEHIDRKKLIDFTKSNNEGDFLLNKFNIDELLTKILQILPYNRSKYNYFLRLDNTEVTPLNNNNLKNLKKLIRKNDDEYNQDEDYYHSFDVNYIYLHKRLVVGSKMPGPGFLPYELTKYVYDGNEDEFKHLIEAWFRYTPNETEKLCCVGNSFKLAEDDGIIPKGCFDIYVAYKLSNGKTYNMKQKDWRHLATTMKIRILVHKSYVGSKSNPYILKYGDAKAKNTLELYDYMDHCFLYERTQFTTWSLTDGYNEEHANLIINKNKGKKDQHIYNTKYNPKGKKSVYSVDNDIRNCVMSLDFIKLMINNKELIKDMKQDKIMDQINYDYKIDHNSDIASGFIEKKRKEGIKKKAKTPFYKQRLYNKETGEYDGDYIEGSDLYDDRIYADFEAINIEKNVRKKDIMERKYYQHGDMLVTKYKDMTTHYLTNDKYTAAQQFLYDISRNNKYGSSKNHIVIFHNLGYDFNFIAKNKGVKITNWMLTTSSKLKCALTKYYGKNIYFKDSYSVISKPLAEFSEVFGFPQTDKGACPYNYYNKETLKEEWANVKDSSKYVKSKDIEEFQESVKPYIKGAINTYPFCEIDNNTLFNHNKHRLDYCVQDVNILQKGYEEFRRWTKELFEEELDFIVSIPQLAFNHVYNEGALDGVCKVNGITQAYLSNFIVGGRCMSANNQKYIEKNIADFDANSLYPSAMCRKDFLVPKGKGRKLLQSECDNWKNKSLRDYKCAYLSINILSVGKSRDFPLIFLKKAKGGGWTNNPPKDDIIFVTKTTLTDIIKYHKITYKVLGGLVWDNNCEVNDILCKVMTNLYELRCKLKKEGKTSQEIVKLIMNATYGKMIMKPIDTTDTWIADYKKGEKNHEKYNEYLNRHYNHIVPHGVHTLEHVACITKYKSVLSHTNYAHIGVNVLDISKRIMNEVMCLAEDKGIKIFYQDTDSMHMYDKDIAPLSKYFKEEYGRDLAGKSLQQFSSDFAAPKGYEKPIAKLSVINGKKCYFDRIESTKIGGNPNDIDYIAITEHARMKGIKEASYRDKCVKEKISLEKLYLRLHKGKAYNFDMNADNGVSFKFSRNFEIESNTNFHRKIQFPNPPNSDK